MELTDNYVHGMDWSIQDDLKGLSSLSNYRKYQYNVISKYIGNNILEVGSGDRSFTKEIVADKPNAERIISIEPSPVLFGEHKDNFQFPSSVSFFPEDLFNVTPDTYGKFDTAIFIHVLEHIEKHKEAIDHTATLLKPGGHVLIEVPALPFLNSRHDEMLGHYRRYTKKVMRSVINTDIYEIVRIGYNDPIGVFGSLLYFKLLKIKLKSGKGTSLIKNQGSFYDKYIIPFEQKIEKYVNFPFGLCLTAILKKKG